MDRPSKHDGAHQHEKHHHVSQRANTDMENDVDAAHDAWTAWKSNDPSAWEAALDLKERINPRAWRQAMREVDKEEAAKKSQTHDVLPSVTIRHDEPIKLGGSSSAIPSDRNYYAGSQVARYYEPKQQQYSVPTEREYRYYPQQQVTQSYYVQRDNDYQNYVQPQAQYYPLDYGYQYNQQRADNYYPQDYVYQYNQQRIADYYPQNYGYQYNQQHIADYYPQNYGYQYNQQRLSNYYPQDYGYRSQQSSVENWIGPAIGGGAGALFDHHNRWRGTVIGGILGTVIQGASRGGFGTGYGGNGIYY